jgi:hypothetical protein
MAAAAAFNPWRVGKESRLFQRLLGEQPLQLHHWVLPSPAIRPRTDLLLAADVGTVSGRSGGYKKGVLANQHAWFVQEPRTNYGSGNSLTTASRQGDKRTTSGYQARQSCAYDRTGNGRNRGEQDIPD